jgi:hypothetical protein
MDEKELWAKFCEGGKVADYLEYRNCVNASGKREKEPSDKDKRTGACDTRTEYR